MFQPLFTVSQALLSNIKRITGLTADLNHARYPRVVLMKLAKKAKDISAHSSTSIEGNPLPLSEVEKILEHPPVKHVRDSEREILNYNKALLHLDDVLNKKKFSLNLNLILKIQKMVTEKLVTPFYSGKLRQGPVFVNDPKLHETIYWPPDHHDVRKLTEDLLQYIHSNQDSMDPLILAGIFHKQFVLIHPFMDGNGRTTRLATKILLANIGLNTFNLFSFENYYNQNIPKYFEKVGERGNYYEIVKKVDFTEWLEYFTDGIIDELLRVGEELRKISVSPKTTLQPYHKKILKFIEQNGFITDKDYAKLVDRAKATRSLDFQRLIGLGFIEKKAKGRATFYVFVSA